MNLYVNIDKIVDAMHKSKFYLSERKLAEVNNTFATCKRLRRQGSLASHLILPKCLTVNVQEKKMFLLFFITGMNEAYENAHEETVGQKHLFVTIRMFSKNSNCKSIQFG